MMSWKKSSSAKSNSCHNNCWHELSEFKGTCFRKIIPHIPGQDQFTLDMLRPTTVASRFTAAQINDKIRKAFIATDLAKIRFEFSLASTNPFGEVTYFEKQSSNFGNFYEDSAINFSCIYPIEPMSGSIAENLSPREVLWVIVPNSSSVVLKELRWRIAIAGLFTLIIFALFILL